MFRCVRQVSVPYLLPLPVDPDTGKAVAEFRLLLVLFKVS